MVWCGSTEVFMKAEDVHKDLASFEKAMKANHPAIAPSMLYAYAAIARGSSVREWRAEPDRGYSGARGICARPRACPSAEKISRPGRR